MVKNNIDTTYNQTLQCSIMGEDSTSLQYQATNQLKVNDIEEIKIDSLPDYDTIDYDIFDDKSFRKYIMDIKNIVRNSIEYRLFVNYLRTHMNMNKCSFFENISNEESFKIKIELHHSPLTLEDIVMIIFEKRMFCDESLEVEMVAKEVMYVHYFLMVGLIPLSETVHGLVHDQLIQIPMNKVLGNYEEFLDIYKQWIPVEIEDKIKRMKQELLSYNNEQNTRILSHKPIHLQLTNDSGLVNGEVAGLEQIKDSMDMLIKGNNNPYSLPQAIEEEYIIPPTQSTEENIVYAFTIED